MSTPPNENFGVHHTEKEHPYKACLIKLLSLLDGISYPPHHDFTPTRLHQITDRDIASFLQKKAYWVTLPTPSDQPTEA